MVVNPFNNPPSACCLFRAVGLVTLLVPVAFQVHEKLDLVLRVGFGVAVLWLVALSDQPLVAGRSIWVYAALAGLAALAWRGTQRLGTHVVSFAAMSVAVFLYATPIWSAGEPTFLQ
jgi:hypothetical protein